MVGEIRAENKTNFALIWQKLKTHFLSKKPHISRCKKVFLLKFFWKCFKHKFLQKYCFYHIKYTVFWQKMCCFTFALISPTTQNLHFFELSKNWNVSKSRITLVVWAKNYLESFSIIWESFHKKTFFFWIDFDFSISKQNYVGFCDRSRYAKNPF